LPEYLVGEVDSTAGRCEEAEERHARAMEFVRTPRNWLSSPEGRQVLGRARSVSRVQAVPCRDEHTITAPRSTRRAMLGIDATPTMSLRNPYRSTSELANR
jgi:hypothetical protein